MAFPLAGMARRYPALVFVSVLAAATALVVKFAHLTPEQAAYLATVIIGVGSVITAFRTHESEISVLTGVAGTVLTGLVSFGLHLSPGIIAIVVSVIGLVMGSLLHLKLTPK